MHKLILCAIPLALLGCQVAVKTPDGTTTASIPVPQAGTTPQAGKVSTAVLPSGIYSYQAQAQRKDGKGILQKETARFSYAVEDLGNGKALIKFQGEASAADPGGFGGLLSGEVAATGIATFSNGVWVLAGKSEDGACESRFSLEGTSIKHLAGRCKDAGNTGDMAWPRANTVLNFTRPLRDSERAELQRSTNTKVATGNTGASGGAFAGVIGKTFPTMQLPYQVFGFDNYNAKLEPFASSEMPEGKVTVYPVRKGATRYVVIAANAGNGIQRVVDVRQAAPAARSLRFVAASPEGGDLVTTCTVNGKPVSQVFGYAQPGKKRSYTAQAGSVGETIWLVQPGGTNVIAFKAGEKLVCKDTVFSG